MEIVPTPFKRSKKYVLSFVTDKDDVEDVERLQSILVEQFKARLLTPTNYEEVLMAENADSIERSLILIANCFEDPASYHSITESAPVPFPGYKGSQHSSQSSLPASSYHSSQDLNPIDWGIYSTKQQNIESFVTTVSRFMAGLDSGIKNKIVIYPCVTESSYSDDGHLSRVTWEENDFPLSNCNKFLLYLNDLMKDKARPPRSVKKVKRSNITSPLQLQQEQEGRERSGERGRRRGEFTESAEKETIPINNVTTFTNHSPEHSSKNFPELNFYTTQKYFLSLITDSNVEVEKIRSVVVGEYKAIEITVENYEEIMKGEDGKNKDGCLILVAYGSDDTFHFGKLEEPSPFFCGCVGNSVDVGSRFGLYSKELQCEKSFIISRETLLEELDDGRMGKLIVYPCVSDDSSFISDDYDSVKWEPINYSPENSNIFLQYLKKLMKNGMKNDKIARKINYSNKNIISIKLDNINDSHNSIFDDNNNSYNDNNDNNNNTNNTNNDNNDINNSSTKNGMNVIENSNDVRNSKRKEKDNVRNSRKYDNDNESESEDENNNDGDYDKENNNNSNKKNIISNNSNSVDGSVKKKKKSSSKKNINNNNDINSNINNNINSISNNDIINISTNSYNSLNNNIIDNINNSNNNSFDRREYMINQNSENSNNEYDDNANNNHNYHYNDNDGNDNNYENDNDNSFDNENSYANENNDYYNNDINNNNDNDNNNRNDINNNDNNYDDIFSSKKEFINDDIDYLEEDENIIEMCSEKSYDYGVKNSQEVKKLVVDYEYGDVNEVKEQSKERSTEHSKEHSMMRKVAEHSAGIKEENSNKTSIRKTESKELSREHSKEHSIVEDKFSPPKTLSRKSSETRKEGRKSFLKKLFTLDFRKTQKKANKESV